MLKATVDGLKNLRRPEDVARIRGLTISQVLPVSSAAKASEESTPGGGKALGDDDPASASRSEAQ
jgi:hypothetical protein